MKFYITYFYNVRFFKSNQIPISTAVWDPKWYHNGTADQTVCFIDKNNVMNGIKEEKLSPATLEHVWCGPECSQKSDVPDCCFLKAYHKYLQTVDFQYVISECARVSEEVRKVTKYIGEPEIVLLVHEKEDNPCSERVPLQEYFEANGIELKNWTKPEGESL